MTSILEKACATEFPQFVGCLGVEANAVDPIPWNRNLMKTHVDYEVLPGVAVGVEEEETTAMSTASENGDDGNPTEVELAAITEMDVQKEEKFLKVIYGEVVTQEDGCEVEGYPAISRGVNRTITTQSLATLIFRAVTGHSYNVLESVPQKVQLNWLFLINLKKLSKPTDVYYDGLGAWDQNCGKITNNFRFQDGEAKDARDEKGEDVVTFVRRTDRNVNCKAYNRVVVTCAKFGLAAIQYFFKSRAEEPFEISSITPKSIRLSSLGDSPTKLNSSKLGLKRKVMSSDDGDASGEIMYLTGGSQDQPVPVRVTALKTVKHNLDSSSLDTCDAQTLLAYLRTFVGNVRQDRIEERLLRKEELELRKKERADDREWRREEAESRKRQHQEDLDMRKQEMALERSRLALEQQRWEIDRREKELFLDLLRKKLLDQ